MPPEALVGSPLKKPRPSMDQSVSNEKYTATQSLSAALDAVVSGAQSSGAGTSTTQVKAKVEEEEEL